MSTCQKTLFALGFRSKCDNTDRSSYNMSFALTSLSCIPVHFDQERACGNKRQEIRGYLTIRYV